MNVILWIIFGAIAGWIASVVMKTDWEQGPIADIILGIVGAVAGGLIMNFFGQAGVTGFNFYSLFVAVLGSIIILFVGRMFYRT